MTETALTIYEPNSITEALQLAKTLIASRLLPKTITTAEQAFTIMAAGKEMGLTAMQALRSIHVIEGKPSCSADLILALCKRHHEVCLYFRLVRSDAAAAIYETRRRGDPEATTLSFTIEQAKAAKLTSKDNWTKYPEAMLRARCIAALARAVYPDLVLGVYETDELPPERVINVAPVRGVVPDDQPLEGQYDPVTGEVHDGGTPPASSAPAGSRPAAEEPDRTSDELLATALTAACIAGFNAETHRTNWLAKHKPEIAGLKARHPDLYQTVKAAYDAAHSGSNGTQQEVQGS